MLEWYRARRVHAGLQEDAQGRGNATDPVESPKNRIAMLKPVSMSFVSVLTTMARHVPHSLMQSSGPGRHKVAWPCRFGGQCHLIFDVMLVSPVVLRA